MVDIADTNRKYDLKKPPNHKTVVPRWTLKFSDNVTHTYTLCVGVQCRSSEASSAAKDVEETVQKLLGGDAQNRPEALDTFRVTEGFDIVGCRSSVAYWTSSGLFETTLKTLDLRRIWRKIPASKEDKQSIRLWPEHFITPLERLETNDARLVHVPGLAQIPACEQSSHDLMGYWGAGRDRIPASADDKF